MPPQRRRVDRSRRAVNPEIPVPRSAGRRSTRRTRAQSPPPIPRTDNTTTDMTTLISTATPSTSKTPVSLVDELQEISKTMCQAVTAITTALRRVQPPRPDDNADKLSESRANAPAHSVLPTLSPPVTDSSRTPLFGNHNMFATLGEVVAESDQRSTFASRPVNSQVKDAPLSSPLSTEIRQSQPSLAIPKYAHTYDGTGSWPSLLALFEANANAVAWSDREATLALVKFVTRTSRHDFASAIF